MSDAAATASTPASIGGSPRYLSPETLRGQQATGAADICSLGITLYEMATGVHCYSAATVDDLFHAHLSESPRPFGAGQSKNDVANPERRDEAPGHWLELVSDPRVSPAELAATRIDFRAWLKKLLGRKRDVAVILAGGESTLTRCGSSACCLAGLASYEASWLRAGVHLGPRLCQVCW